ncbi:hypothetical protein H7H98_03245 [Mycolicibacterium sphagni]|nr:hypothetical protein [Mycolicibacterium sphagni]
MWVGVGLAQASPPGMGCETMRWGFLGSQDRTICDGPRYADGHWDRTRLIYVPAHYVPYSCYFGTYTSSCGGGYDVDLQIVGREKYPVNDGDVLPDEPGWLPPGTDTVR